MVNNKQSPEGAMYMSAVLKLYPTTGVIIVCCALNILAGWICAHYKCSYYYYYINLW